LKAEFITQILVVSKGDIPVEVEGLKVLQISRDVVSRTGRTMQCEATFTCS